ncbi:PilZ domain-containing protein [Candidatus Fermentibacterales bacterium]|nr:PilZ domain-containing protein [Candidatus Fermentibacterales bacterium]
MRDGGGIERRRHPRGYFSFKVSAGNLEDMSSLPLTALNLSASGLYCISPKSLGELARLDLVLHLEDVGEIPARAVVIREERLPGDQFGLGLFFTSVSDGDRARISRVVAGALERESKGGG